MTERRRFSGRERVALWLAADGKCASCGVELGQGWHADHMEPYSKGGRTDVINGQALCPPCNRIKGANVEVGADRTTREGVSPRGWQVKGVDEYRRSLRAGKTNFLAVATPGAGKTLFALFCAKVARAAGFIERVVVVCPSAHLKAQWAEAAAKVGLHLDPTRSNGDGLETGDYDGVAVTYQQVSRASALHRMGVSRRKTLVVLDEVHHAGDEASWGKEIRYAFSEAELRLMLSGTPFRSGGDPMPFVSYENGRSSADYSYGYARALADEVCRPVVFPSYDGEMEWWSEGEWKSATLADDLPEQESRRRLATALDPSGKWLKSILINADAKLSQVRSGEHKDAGGLIIARTQEDARRIADLLHGITGLAPAVATSDNPEATTRISEFAEGSGRWLVAVKMVSEGVDIPRLRIGVYATNIITELFFRQAVGRFVRMLPHLKEQRAYFFIPRDEILIGYAKSIKEERDHEAREAVKDDLREAGREMEEAERQLSLFISGISSEAIEAEVFFDDGLATPEQMGVVRRWREDNPEFAHVADEDILRFIQKLAPHLLGETTPGGEQPASTKEKALYRQVQEARAKVNKMARRVAYVTGREYAQIGWMLKERTGAAAAQRSLSQHQECIKVLTEILEEADGAY